MKKKIIFGLFLVGIIVFNVTVHLQNEVNNISLSNIKILNAYASEEDPRYWDQACLECPQSGTAHYYCISGSGGCFMSQGCVGGIC
jgi:hypothetical protein